MCPSRKSNPRITGVLLAGGHARRLGGGDKSLLPLDHKAILDHVIARARPQVGRLVLNTNSDAARFSRFQLPVIADTVPGFAGPLAGVLAAMAWLREQPAASDTHWLASFPADSPFFPADLVERLYRAVSGGNVEIACAAANGRRSPLFALWSTALMEALRRQLQKQDYKVGNFLDQRRCTVVHFDAGPVDPFFNINTEEELAAARQLMNGRAVPDRPAPDRSSPGRSSPGRSSPGRSNPRHSNPGHSNPGRCEPE